MVDVTLCLVAVIREAELQDLRIFKKFPGLRAASSTVEIHNTKIIHIRDSVATDQLPHDMLEFIYFCTLLLVLQERMMLRVAVSLLLESTEQDNC